MIYFNDKTYFLNERRFAKAILYNHLKTSNTHQRIDAQAMILKLN